MKKLKVFLMLLVIAPAAVLLAACGCSSGVASIKIASVNHKVKYYQNEVLDTSGLAIEVTHTNGTTENVYVSELWVEGFDSSSYGSGVLEKTLTVTYGGKTATYVVGIYERVKTYTHQFFGLSSDYNVGDSKVNSQYTYQETVDLILRILKDKDRLTITNDIFAEVVDDITTGEMSYTEQLINAFYEEYNVEVKAEFESRIETHINDSIKEYREEWMVSAEKFDEGIAVLAENALVPETKTHFGSYFAENSVSDADLKTFWTEVFAKEQHGVQSLFDAIEEPYNQIIERVVSLVLVDVSRLELQLRGAELDSATLTTFYGNLFKNQMIDWRSLNEDNPLITEMIFLEENSALNDKFFVKELENGTVDVVMTNWDSEFGFSDREYGSGDKETFEKYMDAVLEVRSIFIDLLDSINLKVS